MRISQKSNNAQNSKILFFWQRNTIFAESLQSWVNFSPQASFAVVINALRVCSITLLQYIAFIKFGTSCRVLILCMTWQIFLIYKPTSVWMSDYLMKKIEKDWMLPWNQSLDIFLHQSLDCAEHFVSCFCLGWSHTDVLSSERINFSKSFQNLEPCILPCCAVSPQFCFY